MNSANSTDFQEHEDPTASRPRRGTPAFVKALIAVGVLAVIVAAYMASVRDPSKDRLLVKHELMTVALLYHEYNTAHGKAPSSLADLESFTHEDAIGIGPPDRYEAPQAFEMIRDGRFIIIWDAALYPDGDTNEEYVLGYEASAANSGGLVMRAGGSVRDVSAEEFNALRRIKTKKDLELVVPGWSRHATPDGLCSAEFPAPPNRMTFGGDLDRLTLQREAGKGHYALTAVDMPEDSNLTQDEVLDEWREKHLAAPLLGGGRFELIEESEVDLDGAAAGRQVHLQAGPEKVSLNRVFLFDRRIYRANVVIDTERKDDDDAWRFLASVRFQR